MTEKAYCTNKINIFDEYKKAIINYYKGNFEIIDFVKNQEAADVSLPFFVDSFLLKVGNG